MGEMKADKQFDVPSLIPLFDDPAIQIRREFYSSRDEALRADQEQMRKIIAELGMELYHKNHKATKVKGPGSQNTADLFFAEAKYKEDRIGLDAVVCCIIDPNDKEKITTCERCPKEPVPILHPIGCYSHGIDPVVGTLHLFPFVDRKSQNMETGSSADLQCSKL
ncbi:hypothetical protein LINPERPRIM_LOCUS17903 [Linum perenne]